MKKRLELRMATLLLVNIVAGTFSHASLKRSDDGVSPNDQKEGLKVTTRVMVENEDKSKDGFNQKKQGGNIKTSTTKKRKTDGEANSPGKSANNQKKSKDIPLIITTSSGFKKKSKNISKSEVASRSLEKRETKDPEEDKAILEEEILLLKKQIDSKKQIALRKREEYRSNAKRIKTRNQELEDIEKKNAELKKTKEELANKVELTKLLTNSMNNFLCRWRAWVEERNSGDLEKARLENYLRLVELMATRGTISCPKGLPERVDGGMQKLGELLEAAQSAEQKILTSEINNRKKSIKKESGDKERFVNDFIIEGKCQVGSLILTLAQIDRYDREIERLENERFELMRLLVETYTKKSKQITEVKFKRSKDDFRQWYAKIKESQARKTKFREWVDIKFRNPTQCLELITGNNVENSKKIKGKDIREIRDCILRSSWAMIQLLTYLLMAKPNVEKKDAKKQDAEEPDAGTQKWLQFFEKVMSMAIATGKANWVYAAMDWVENPHPDKKFPTSKEEPSLGEKSVKEEPSLGEKSVKEEPSLGEKSVYLIDPHLREKCAYLIPKPCFRRMLPPEILRRVLLVRACIACKDGNWNFFTKDDLRFLGINTEKDEDDDYDFNKLFESEGY